MGIKATLAPGQNNTRLLLKQHGDQFVCVRYRYHKTRQKRIKSIELVVDVKDWIPGAIIPAGRKVALKIGFDEAELREQIKTAGGYWNPDQKACLLSYKKVLQLGLERRMIDQKADL